VKKSKVKAPKILNLITDKVLAYQPKEKEKEPRKRLPKKKKQENGE